MSEIIFEFPEVPQFNFLIDLQGASLYQKWLELGNDGDYADFLDWLRIQGETGMSAYDLAVSLGFSGTEAEWLNSLAAKVSRTIIPSDSPLVGEVGKTYWYALVAGTYTDFGGVVVNPNSLAIIMRNDSGTFSITQTSIPQPENKINPWIAQSYASGSQVNYLGKDWVSNDATIAGDIPGTSSKWIERLSSYLDKKTTTSLIWTNGFFYSIFGVLSVNASYSVSQKIYVKKGVSSFMTSIFSGSMNAISFFDINNNYLSGITVVSKTNYSNETFIVPEKTNYFVLSNLTANTSAMRLYENALDVIIKAFDNTKGIGIVEKENSDLITGNTAFDALLIPMKSEIIIVPDFYINTSGVLIENTGCNYTSFIKINPKGNYYLSLTTLVNPVQTHAIVTYYDINKVRISSFNSSGTSINYDKEKLTIPATAYYFRLTISDSSLGSYEIFTDSSTNYKEISSIAPKYEDVTRIVVLNNGFYYNTSGVKTAIVNWFVTNFLEVTTYGDYYLTMTGASGTYNIVSYFDADYNYISGISSATKNVFNNDKLTIPLNAKFFVVSNSIALSNTLLLNSNLYTAIAQGISKVSSSNLGFVTSKYFDAVINEQNNIFLDNLTIDKTIQLDTLGSSINIKRVNRSLRITPTTSLADMPLVLTNSKNKLTYTATVRTISKTIGDGTVAKNILLIGDSLTAAQAFSAEVYTKLNTDADFIFNQIGTKGTTFKHEGISGAVWHTFTGVGSPFYTGGAINFAQYCTNNSFSGIDIVMINLGTNDIPRGTSVVTLTAIQTIISNAKILVDYIFASFPLAKVSIGLQAIGAPQFPTANISADIFRTSMIMLNQAYVANFDNGVYNVNLTTHNRHTSIDRDWSYEFVDENISTRNSNKWRKYTNDVHPFTIGYQQFADADYSKIRAFLSGLL